MSGNTTTNTDPAIRGQLFSQLVLETIKDGYLPEGLYRNVSDFGDGTTLYIPTLGEMTLFDLVENQETPESPLDTGQISLTITDHVGVAGWVSDELKEDGYKAAVVEANIVPSALRAIDEAFETAMLAQAVSTSNGIITLSDPNTYNGFDHRWIANGTGNVITVADFIHAKVAFDKAHVPAEGRIAIVDPIVEATINSLTGISDVTYNPRFEGVITTGFAREHKFIRNIFGWDIWTSNRLPRITSESITSVSAPGDTDLTDAGGSAVNNIFMSVMDDQMKPFMGAQRRPPRVEGMRHTPKRRDEYHTTARWGFGVQRGETLASVLTSAVNY